VFDEDNMTDMEFALLLVEGINLSTNQNDADLIPKLSNSHLMYAADAYNLLKNPYAKKILKEALRNIHTNQKQSYQQFPVDV
jgi:hypothetical protein